MCEPLISVVIPCFNSASFLPETLESVFGQDFSGAEVILVDDGSTDETASVLKPYHARIKYIRQENFGGPSRPRNLGVQAARGKLIALFDSDDVMLPGKLTAAVEAFRADAQLDLVFTDFRVIGDDGSLLRSHLMDRYQEFRRVLQPAPAPLAGILQGRELYRELLKANFIGTSSVAIKRDAVLAIGGFDESLKNSDDCDLWFRLALAGRRFGYISREYHAYRSREDSVTHGGAKRFASVLAVLQKQLSHVQTPGELGLLHDMINIAMLSEAWGMSQEGRYDTALAAYRRALRDRFTWLGLKGLLVTRLKQLTAR